MIPLPLWAWAQQHERLAAVLLLLCGLVISSVVLHIRHGAPEFVPLTKDPAVKQQRVTVYWAGMQVDGNLHSLPLQPLWLKYGDVLIVKYDPRLVSRSKIKKATYRKLRELGYEEITANFTSFGARLALDFFDYVEKMGNKIKISGAVGNDPIIRGSDTLGTNKVLGWPLSCLFPDYATNWVFRDMVEGMHSPPSLDQIEPGMDEQSIREHWKVSANWPLSGVASQARAFFWAGAVPAGKYSRIPLHVLRSPGDNVVSLAAGKDLLDAFYAPVGHLREVRSPYPGLTPLHASFREFPEAWWNAQQEAYEELYATA